MHGRIYSRSEWSYTKWRQARCLFGGKFGNNIPCHPGTTTSSCGATEPRPANRFGENHQSCARERPRTALSRRSGNAFRVDAAEAGYRFGPNFIIGERCRSYRTPGRDGSPGSGTCTKEVRSFGRLLRTPGGRLCCVSLLAALEPSKRPLKDYANKPVEQTDERREAISRWPCRSVYLTGRRQRPSVPHAYFWR